MDLVEFLAALAADWITLMSGIASVVLLVVGVARNWGGVPRAAFWIAAAVCFFFASARVWTIQHRAGLQAKNDNKELQRKLNDLTKPQLFCRVDSAGWGHSEDHPDAVIVMLMASVGNQGADSVAVGYSAEISNETRKLPLAFLAPIKSDKGLNATFGAQRQKFYRERELFEITAASPIKRGDLKTGPLIFMVPKKDFDLVGGLRDGSQVTVSFSDYLGTRVSSTMTYRSLPKDRVPYYPGSGVQLP